MAERHKEEMTRGARRAVIILFVITFALAAGNLIFSSGQVNHLAGVVHKQDAQARVQAATVAQLREQLLAACGSAGDLGSIPIPQKPKPSRLAISLVTNNRLQWRALHCPGSLPTAASLGLARWAAYYHLPAS